MMSKPGFLLRLLGSLFFKKVDFPLAQTERLNTLHREGSVVYVLSSQSLLDYLYFNWAFLDRGLPLAVYGQGMWMGPFRTLGSNLRRLWRWISRRGNRLTDEQILERAPGAHEPVVVFLRKARSIVPWPWGDEDPLRPLVRAQAQLDTPIVLVPIIIIWERAPSTLKRSLWDKVFGDFDAPGRMRKLLNFVGNHGHAIVQTGDPLYLPELLASRPADEGLVSQCRSVRYELNTRFHQEHRVIRGPVQKTSRQMRDEMLRPESFRRLFGALAESEDRPPEEVSAQIRSYLEEIAADMRVSWIEALCYALTFIFDRIYRGIEVEGLNLVREEAKRTPLVILPSHKSHIDYLVISLIFYVHAMVPPQIAAGNNLNFWPLGPIFRGSGAFFLRRSFRQDDVYAATFRAYVLKLLKEGYTVEFFLEGGRSRTGKLLRPRYGLLSHVVDAVMEGQTNDVALCPTSIGYEKIIEGESYVRELSGGSKDRENVGQLLGAAKVLRERFGRVYASFDSPISLRAFLEDHGVDIEAGFESEEQKRAIVKRLAYRVLGGIDRVTVVTASSVVAAALLTTPKRGLSETALVHRSGVLVDYLLNRGAPLASGLKTPLAANRVALERTRPEGAQTLASALRSLSSRDERARVLEVALRPLVEETAELFVSNKHLTRHTYVDGVASASDASTPDTAVYQVPSDRRIDLDYYKNNLVQHFVREGILAAALLRCAGAGDTFGDRLRREAAFLSTLLKLEYVFSQGLGFDRQYRTTLAAFETAGLIDGDRAARVHIAEDAKETLVLLASMVLPVVEGYFVVAHGTAELGAPCEKGELRRALQKRGEQLWREGRLRFREAVSSVVFDNCFTWLEAEGYLSRSTRPAGRKVATWLGPGVRRETEPECAELLAERIEAFLVPLRA